MRPSRTKARRTNERGVTSGRADGPAVVVAPMRTSDVKAVLAIEEASFPEPWSRRLFIEELAQRTSRAYRALWIGRDLVGYFGLMFVDDEAHLNSIAVDPAHQGTGLGTVLFLDLVDTALSRGARHLTLEVRVGNDAAVALYRRFGMAPVGVRAGYYASGDDALVMWVRDIDSEEFAARLARIRRHLPPGLEVHSRR
jgi:[ribosomal protein S18]-alanine N-acetyltransferase